MNLGSTQFVPSSRFCKPIHQMTTIWDEFKSSGYLDSPPPPVIIDIDPIPENQSEDVSSHGNLGSSSRKLHDQQATKPDKVLRRQAQNREAARKSRLRKKAYVQQLEKCKQRLIQLEQERDQSPRQGLYVDGSLDSIHLAAYPERLNQGVATFEMGYGRWVEDQKRLMSELRNAMNSNIGDMELAVYVKNGLNHFYDLFSMKALAVKADAFYIMSGLWRTPAERLFSWIGGFRPSEILKVVSPHLDPLSEQQRLEISLLIRSCQQAEDALSKGMDRLYQIITETIAGDGNYPRQVSSAMEKLQGLITFVSQADHLRQETLQQVYRLLSPSQAARGLLALGDYIQRLQALSSAWASTRHPNCVPSSAHGNGK